MKKTFKQLLCLFGILAALTLVGCSSVKVHPVLSPDDPLLQDNLIEESQGGPVVAPTTIQQQQNQGGDVDFGKEKYIWDDWQ